MFAVATILVPVFLGSVWLGSAYIWGNQDATGDRTSVIVKDHK